MKRIRLFVYHADEDDPKKCSAKKMHKFGFVKLEKNIKKVPRNTILLNPFAKKSLSKTDWKTARENGITAIDCSWKHAEKSFDYLDKKIIPEHSRFWLLQTLLIMVNRLSSQHLKPLLQHCIS